MIPELRLFDADEGQVVKDAAGILFLPFKKTIGLDGSVLHVMTMVTFPDGKRPFGILNKR